MSDVLQWHLEGWNLLHIQHKLLLLGSAVVLKAVWCFNGLDDNYWSCQPHTTKSDLNLKRFHPIFSARTLLTRCLYCLTSSKIKRWWRPLHCTSWEGWSWTHVFTKNVNILLTSILILIILHIYSASFINKQIIQRKHSRGDWLWKPTNIKVENNHAHVSAVCRLCWKLPDRAQFFVFSGAPNDCYL